MPKKNFGDVASLARQARLATAIMFFTNGALIANVLPRYPELKSVFALNDSAYGWVVAAVPAGAMLAGASAGLFTRRLGQARTATLFTILAAVTLWLAVTVPQVAFLVLLFACVGGLDAIIDVAQNAHGLVVQRLYGRSIINGFHAVWSIGAVTGSIMAAAAIALHLPLTWHLGASGVFCVVLVAVASRLSLPPSFTASAEPSAPVLTPTLEMPTTDAPATGVPGVEDAHAAPPERTRFFPALSSHRASTWRIWMVLAALVIIGSAGAVVEDLGNSWAALYLGRDLGAARSLSAFGLTAVVGAQFVGRLLGDRMVDRWGERAVVRGGAVLIMSGMTLALMWPNLPLTLVAFAAAGFGSATLVPAAMHAADNLPGLPPGTGLTAVSWLMRLGFLTTPPLVGAVAQATSLRVGLFAVPLAGAATFALARVLPALRDAKTC